MKMVICFDTEDEKGMENSIKMMNHLAQEYMSRSIASSNEARFGKIEFIKVLRIFAENIAKEQGLVKESVEKDPSQPRRKEEWEGLRYAKEFADKVYKAKDGGKRIGQAGAPASLLKC